jgi:hypothetical protein
MDNVVAAAVDVLDDLARRLSVPGATCTASEIAAVADRLRNAVPATVDNTPVAEAIQSLQAEVANLAADVTAVPAG